MKFTRLDGLDDAARAGLSEVLGDELSETRLREQLASGIAELWRTDEDSYLITRIEGPELVVCCYQGSNASDMLESIKPAARKAGCTRLRFHTQRPGLARLLQTHNPELTEYVFKVPL